MRRVCIFSLHAGEKTGIGSVVLNVADLFEKKGWEVVVVAESGDYHKRQLLVDFKSKNPLRLLSALIRIYIFIGDIDLILLYDARPAGHYALLTALLKRKPLYLHCVGTYSLFLDRRNWIKNTLMFLVYQFATKTYVLGTFVKRKIEESKLGFEIKNPILLGPGVRVNYFDGAFRNDRGSNGYLITVGEVKSRKGQDVSIDAFANLVKKFPLLTYKIIGRCDESSPFFRLLLEKIKKNNLEGKVTFLGEVDDTVLKSLYEESTIFLMTPRTTKNYLEGFGIVYLEAALSGVTSVGTYDSGAEDAIIHNETGLLAALEPLAISNAIQILIEDTNFRNVLAKRARERAKKYTWKNVVECYINHFESKEN